MGKESMASEKRKMINVRFIDCNIVSTVPPLTVGLKGYGRVKILNLSHS